LLLIVWDRQYLNRKSLKERPTAHLSYDEGLHLVRSFLEFASHNTVDELQAFTAQWVPHPQWIKVDVQSVSDEHLSKAAELIQQQLGPDGIKEVGGRQWWQWRRPNSPLEAEWIEMKSDANARKQSGDRGKRVMLYVHGGGYFFGSVDEHRYQMQRHARKLKARVFAPRYRLAPQFPFPCGIQDCLAAYLYLLTVQQPSEIVLAGDSAGGGMVLTILCILRDQGIPLPAGGILISPWADLTHSFPSVGDPAPLDYIPQHGFHHKPSRAWPPPNDDDLVMLQKEVQKRKSGLKTKKPDTGELEEKQQKPVAEKTSEAAGKLKDSEAVSGGVVTDVEKFLTVTIDGKKVEIKDQIQVSTQHAPGLTGGLTEVDVHNQQPARPSISESYLAAEFGWPASLAGDGWRR
jgi:acetyl esterase/lipase